MFIIKTKEGALLNLDQWEGVKIDKSKDRHRNCSIQ